jgi:hypothetical protein
MTTKKPVTNLPKSTIAPAEPELLSMKSSGLAQYPHIMFGSGARIYVATTRTGYGLWKRTLERMMRMKPMARTKERRMSVLRPAIVAGEIGWRLDVGGLGMRRYAEVSRKVEDYEVDSPS